MFNKRRAVNGDALIVTRNGGYNQLTTKQQIDVVCLLDGTVVNVVCNVWKWYWPRRVTIRGTAIFHKRLMDKSGFDWFIFPITGAKVKFENFSVGDQVDVTLVPTAGIGRKTETGDPASKSTSDIGANSDDRARNRIVRSFLVDE